ncbi:MAG: hypothetical protein NTV86_09825 [Planctomycetota bacterium]|nr:hypothetical protein [Planctomycetota bacterium]
MKKQPPITHLIVGTSSTGEDDNGGGCDFCLVPMTAEYITHLLGLMDEVRRLHRADDSVYSLECWDAGAAYFHDNDWFQELRDVDGHHAGDIPEGEPILLAANTQFDDADFQRVECQSVQFVSDDVWWTACVRHANIHIESAHVERKTLLKILRGLGGVGESRRHAKARTVPPAIRRIHDLLYLDTKDGRQSYAPDRAWDADTMAAIAEVVAEFIPRPKAVRQDRRTPHEPRK